MELAGMCIGIVFYVLPEDTQCLYINLNTAIVNPLIGWTVCSHRRGKLSQFICSYACAHHVRS